MLMNAHMSFGVLVHTMMPSEPTDQISCNIAVDVVLSFSLLFPTYLLKF